MWGKVSELLGVKERENSSQQSELQLATAALMVHVSMVDEEFSENERDQLLGNLVDHFDVSEATAAALIRDAEAEQQDATCLYRFTRVVTGELDQTGRQDIIRLLWRIAIADGTIDAFEKNIIAKVAGLLGVSPSDRIRLKHEVEATVH